MATTAGFIKYAKSCSKKGVKVFRAHTKKDSLGTPKQKRAALKKRKALSSKVRNESKKFKGMTKEEYYSLQSEGKCSKLSVSTQGENPMDDKKATFEKIEDFISIEDVTEAGKLIKAKLERNPNDSSLHLRLAILRQRYQELLNEPEKPVNPTTNQNSRLTEPVAKFEEGDYIIRTVIEILDRATGIVLHTEVK